MKKTAIILAMIAGGALAGSAAVRHLNAITVTEGESISVAAQNAERVTSANPNVVTASLREKDVNVSGVGLGATVISFSDDRGTFADAKVTVVPAYWEVLSRIFADDPEITTEIVGGKVVLSGSTASSQTLKRVNDAKALDSERIITQVTFSAGALQVIVQDFLSRIGSTNITATVVGREVCLSGRVFDAASAKALGERVEKFIADFPDVHVNVEGLRVFKQKILISIEFVDWDDTRARDLGIRGPDMITGTADFNWSWDFERNAGDAFSSANGPTRDNDRHHNWKAGAKVGVEKFNVTLKMLKRNAVIRKTYGTTLATQSGEEVKFQNGGTHYMRTGGTFSTGDLREVDWGYSITARPIIIDDETLNLDFDLDYSNVLPSANQDDYDTQRYQTKSRYVVRPGESVVLSGFDGFEDEVAKNGIPFLSRIPYMDWLFGETNRSNRKLQKLLIVSVNWLVEDSEAAQARLKELKSREAVVEMP